MDQKVSIVIPCRNEEKYIKKCVESLISQYPVDKLEILVVDGASTDDTHNVVVDLTKKYPFVKLFENPKKYTPISKNVGIKNSTGDIIMILGAHSELHEGYVKRCVQYLAEYNADAVGGRLITKPIVPTRVAKAIVIVLTSFLGTGGSAFRTGTVKKIQEVDTVFNPCFRKEVFQKIGLYNEKLIRTQDYDLNTRLKRAGGKILLAPDISAVYYPKATLLEFWKHNVADGIWAILPVKIAGTRLKPRHFAPVIFVAGFFGTLLLSFVSHPFFYLFLLGLVSYTAIVAFYSVKKSLESNDLFLLPFLVPAFFIRHFAYGIGSLMGLFLSALQNS